MNRHRLNRLESLLVPAPPSIRAATVAKDGTLRGILDARGILQKPAKGLTTADLPDDCVVFEYDPTREIALPYLSTEDGQPHLQMLLGVTEDDF